VACHGVSVEGKYENQWFSYTVRSMAITKSNHCAYDTHYHIVCPVKYRRALLNAEIVNTIRDTIHGLEERYDLTFE
jgi:hypothetical protein